MNVIVWLGVGVIIGVVIGYLWFKTTLLNKYILKSEYEATIDKNTGLEISLAKRFTQEYIDEKYISFGVHKALKDNYEELNESILGQVRTIKERDESILELTEKRITKEELENNYISKKLYDDIRDRLNKAEEDIVEKDNLNGKLNIKLTEIERDKINLDNKLEELKEFERQFKEQFQNLATKILKGQSEDFVKTNKDSLDKLLDPLKIDILNFKKTITDNREKQVAEATSLKTEIESIQKMSIQFNEKAERLAKALSSDVKVQGNWGEDRLNLILEMEGLQSHVDYSSQSTHRDNDDRLKKPDFLIHLPQKRDIILDSKVTLTSYSDFCNSIDPDDKKTHLKRLKDSMVKHIELLSSKEYQNLPGLHTLDYVIMFVPIEPALTLVVHEFPDIYRFASDKKVVLLTPTSLMPVAKLIRQLWDNEKRIANIENIFKKVGALYDKFSGFVNDMKAIEQGLKKAGDAYQNAMNKLTTSVKQGDTVIGRFHELTNLGVKVKSQLDASILREVAIESGEMIIKHLGEGEIGNIDEQETIDLTDPEEFDSM